MNGARAERGYPPAARMRTNPEEVSSRPDAISRTVWEQAGTAKRSRESRRREAPSPVAVPAGKIDGGPFANRCGMVATVRPPRSHFRVGPLVARTADLPAEVRERVRLGEGTPRARYVGLP
jgi:hypothetical protein